MTQFPASSTWAWSSRIVGSSRGRAWFTAAQRRARALSTAIEGGHHARPRVQSGPDFFLVHREELRRLIPLPLVDLTEGRSVVGDWLRVRIRQRDRVRPVPGEGCRGGDAHVPLGPGGEAGRRAEAECVRAV